jgi:demethylmenaquinone methyltransferase/2-methoxy-6-polyprenyl-1,4-benzoquinol methylase
MSAETTHFGYKQVPLEEKASHVREVFNSVASRYDVMNDLMSAGLHRWWKQQMIAALPRQKHLQLLDLAGGTGDIAFRAKSALPDAEITLCDINAAMLKEGQKRALDKGLFHGIHWLCGNAEALPLPDASQDACTIAFGIRNVTDIPQALREIYRVLKPGGKFLCLEFSPLTASHPLIHQLYDIYSFHLIPPIGQMVTGDADSYRYLVESIRRFPDAETFQEMITQAGFSRVHYERFSFGVVALHSGWKI